MVYDTNAFLTQSQMQENAQFIAGFFIQHGWTPNAISGLLGNLQSESSINFGIWEGLNEGNMSGGFGLTQWTPASKYFDWANANGYGNDHVNGELNRLLWEVANNQQWFGGVSGSMTFQQWTQSTDTPYNLAMDFIATYEHPANPNQPNRGTQAETWYSTLDWSGAGYTGGTGGGGGSPPSTDANKQLMTLWLVDALNGFK
jgi:hypothetical protein